MLVLISVNLVFFVTLEIVSRSLAPEQIPANNATPLRRRWTDIESKARDLMRQTTPYYRVPGLEFRVEGGIGLLNSLLA